MTSRQGIRILIADDDPDDRYLLTRVLEKYRIARQITTFSDGEQLIAYLREHLENPELTPTLPSLILLDLNMPVLDGREALASIKSSPSLRSLPVVILSTSEHDEDVRLCYELGANAFVAKPASLDEYGHVAELLHAFWLKTARLPRANRVL